MINAIKELLWLCFVGTLATIVVCGAVYLWSRRAGLWLRANDRLKAALVRLERWFMGANTLTVCIIFFFCGSVLGAMIMLEALR